MPLASALCGPEGTRADPRNARRRSAAMAGEAHPDPSRTRKLSPRAPMVLRGQPVGEQDAADQRRAFRERARCPGETTPGAGPSFVSRGRWRPLGPRAPWRAFGRARPLPPGPWRAGRPRASGHPGRSRRAPTAPATRWRRAVVGLVVSLLFSACVLLEPFWFALPSFLLCWGIVTLLPLFDLIWVASSHFPVMYLVAG